MNQEVVAVTAGNRYAQLQGDRDHFVERADECAKLTLPMLFQRDVGSTKNMKIKDPAQTSGARGVNTLGSKMILSLMPVNTPFFKMNIDAVVPEIDEDMKKEVKKGLGVIERQAITDIENSGDITVVFEAVKHLIVTGNALLYVGEDGARMYDLNKFVVVRKANDDWSEIVVCEEVSPASLPQDVIELVRQQAVEGQSPEKTLKLYTHIKKANGRVKWHQEISGQTVPGSESEVAEDASPWIPMRFLRVDGEAYGRAYVEMFLGDLKSLEVLSRAVNDASAAAAKTIFLVKPNGTTSTKVLADAPNLSIRTGNADDVTVLRMDKAADLRVAKEMIDTIKRDLAFAFLMNVDAMRDAERVTAEEIRYVAQELDASLGGIYSLLSKEFQLPYVKRRLFLLRKKKNIPKLPDTVKPAIVTGFAAIGRGHDSEKLMRFIEKVNLILQNPSLGQMINLNELIERIAIAEGIELGDLLIDPKTQQQNQTQAQGMDMAQQAMPELLKQAGPLIQQQMMEGSQNGGEVQTQN